MTSAIAAGRKDLVAGRDHVLLVALALQLVAVKTHAVEDHAASVVEKHAVLVVGKHAVLVAEKHAVLVAEKLERSVALPWLSDACSQLVVEGCNTVAAMVVRIQETLLGQDAGFAAAALVLRQNVGLVAAVLVLERLGSPLLAELLELAAEENFDRLEIEVSSACCSSSDAP